MIRKQILPETFGFDVPSVDIIGCGSHGLDKTAMVKRASVSPFEDVILELKPSKNRTYLHVITTGAMETYQNNLNGDAFNESAHEYVVPFPEAGGEKVIMLDGGLKKYHDKSYMDGKAAVYQEHHSNEEPSGEIIAARYNDDMHRGELIIAVDTDKWAPRLQRKANGENIYLSMGCRVPFDRCLACGHKAHTMGEHCDHFKKMRNKILDDGTKVGVINDRPEFYDISGVNAPADKIAFVLREVGSGGQVKTASVNAAAFVPTRTPMPFVKAAAVLKKLSAMEKRIDAISPAEDSPEFDEDEDKSGKLLVKVVGYPADEVIASCNRKGILLSPGTLFKLIGRECTEENDRECLEACDDDCCGDCSAMMREMEEDDSEERNSDLMDGSFDTVLPVDLGLDRLLEQFMPALGMGNPEVMSRSVHIIITGDRPKRLQRKEASYSVDAQDALRRTYARYVISFAAQNDDATCMNALRKIARYGK